LNATVHPQIDSEPRLTKLPEPPGTAVVLSAITVSASQEPV
jgi:hypothetical protein